ncbi:hypothetical protein [Pararhodobacter zhoushanensis]|uniref:Minor tail protein n=1 Tax=Pararhodobacter zhoushanensis TaxID=2479545 RepID=A0ABT3H2X3_9RHOB|nr:hypothetical protein [Pararhodobacter zhoushanensis]MCW1934131.1 hypothetical protein [Pararhodobacter zhoushanensis]
MAGLLKLSGPVGLTGPAGGAQSSALQSAALEAMIAGGARGLIYPTSGAADRYYQKSAYDAFIQDALFPDVEYQFPLAAGAPAGAASATNPALDFTVPASPNGARSTIAEQVDGYDGANNPDLWMVLCVTPGDQDSPTVMMSVLASSGFGTAIYRPNALDKIIFAVDSTHTLDIVNEEASPELPHVYSVRYEVTTGYARTYRDGVQTNNWNLTSMHPTAQMVTGPIGIGAVGAIGTAAVFTNDNGLFHLGCVGNGILTNAQHTAIIDWIKDLYGIA